MALVLLAIIVTPTDSAQAASQCTGWQSTLTAPSSIKVYRTAQHRTVTVGFRQYVLTVMASEWGHSHPRAALRAGAVAIKQYGWYYAMHWRGGRDAAGRCYDVVDSTQDQVYDPHRQMYSVYATVVDETWSWSLRKGARFFPTGYRSGDGICGRQQDGWHLMQLNAARCASSLGESTETILRRYYGTDVSLVIPGAGDVTGDGVGDVTAVTTDPTTGGIQATIFSSDVRLPPTMGPAEALVGSAPPLSAPAPLALVGDATVLGRASVDVTGDGRSDLVRLLASPDGTLTLDVMASTGLGFAPSVTWWSSAIQGPALSAADVRLVTGDFDGDGVGDVGLVETIPATAFGDAVPFAPSTQLVILRSRLTGFRAALTWWTAPTDLSGSRFLAGDVTGDGRADLIVLQPTPDGLGTSALVAPSTTKDTLGPAQLYGAIGSPIEDLKALVGDVDRTGRDDIILARRDGADQLSLVVLTATWDSRFVASTWWSSAVPFSWALSKLAVADLDGDGRADVVIYQDASPDAGTNAYSFLSTGTAFRGSLWKTLPSLDWGSFEAY